MHFGIGGVLVKGIGFVLLPLYTHYLSPRDYGLLEVLELGISLLAMFLNMGVTAALLRYYGAAQTAAEKRKIVSTIFSFAIATSAVVFVIGSLVVRPATYFLLGPGVPTNYLFIALVAFLIAYIGNIPYTALRAREASGTVTLLDMFTTVGLVSFNIYFVVFLHMSVMGMLLSRAIMNVVNVAVLVKLTSGQLFGGIDWKLLRVIIAFGAPLVFSNLTMFTLNFSDRFFLQHFQSLEAVGTCMPSATSFIHVEFSSHTAFQHDVGGADVHPPSPAPITRSFVRTDVFLVFGKLDFCRFGHSGVRPRIDEVDGRSEVRVGRTDYWRSVPILCFSRHGIFSPNWNVPNISHWVGRCCQHGGRGHQHRR